MANKDHSLDSKIIDAALEEFSTYGFQRASLHKIASNANVTTGALYTRYKNKNDLFSSLVNVIFENFKPYTEKLTSMYMNAHNNKDVDGFIDALKYEWNLYFNVLYDNKKEAILLLCKSDGSEAKEFFKKMMCYKETNTVEFFEQFAKDKSERENNSEILENFDIDRHAIVMLMNMQFSLFDGVLQLNLSKEKSLKCMDTMGEFITLGWKNLFEKYL